MEEEYPNECGVCVGGLTVGELMEIVTDLKVREVRQKILRLLVGMLESNQTSIALVYHPLRGKK
jgi:hypothetical protein